MRKQRLLQLDDQHHTADKLQELLRAASYHGHVGHLHCAHSIGQRHLLNVHGTAANRLSPIMPAPTLASTWRSRLQILDHLRIDPKDIGSAVFRSFRQVDPAEDEILAVRCNAAEDIIVRGIDVLAHIDRGGPMSRLLLES